MEVWLRLRGSVDHLQNLFSEKIKICKTFQVLDGRSFTYKERMYSTLGNFDKIFLLVFEDYE